MFEMAAYPNVYLKLTTAIIRRSREAPATPQSYLRKLLSAFGSSRIAWGSNYPAIEGTLPEAVADARNTLAILPEADQDNIFWRTATELYPALAGR